MPELPHSEDELVALLAVDALPPDEQADAELRAGTFPAGMADVVAALAEFTAQPPPASLRDRTLDRARRRRPADRPVGGAVACSPGEAYERTVAEFAAVLAELGPAEWTAAAHEEHGTVRDLVAHLVGVERLCLGWLDAAAPPPVDPHLDHVSATRPAVVELAGVPGPEVARRWRAAAGEVSAAAAAGDRTRPASFHDVATTADGLLVIRTFELWAHWMDIALATGRPVPVLDPARMALLSASLMRFVPRALAYRGAPPAGVARFVLLGEAGGCYTVALDPGRRGAEGAEPDVTITADAVDLCRVAARRLPAAELDRVVEGDRVLGAAILADLDALARD
jgi:uncharacterized protein (TIGR03083 family)